MIIAANHVDIDGFIGGGFESPFVETKAFSSISKDFFEKTCDAGLFASTGWSVEEEMGEGLRIFRQGFQAGCGVGMVGQLREILWSVFIYP